MKVLVVAEHLQGQVQEITAELITAARSFADSVVLAVIADAPSTLVDKVNLEGVDEVVAIRGPSSEFESDIYRQAITVVYNDVEPDVILTGFTMNSIGYGPAIAASLELGFASDVFAIEKNTGELLVNRAFYGQKVHAELGFSGGNGILLMLRKGTWQAAEGTGAASVRELPVEFDVNRTRHIAFQEAQGDSEEDITGAEFILCVGRGIGEEENLEQFKQLAKKMGAAFAVSRPIVDAGWIPRSRQVGQSGKTVKPKVYLSLGVSGAIQHLAGMKDSGLIISVNTDPEASIFNVAHYGAAIDLFDVADELEKHY